MTDKKPDHRLILSCWVLLAIYATGMALCLMLWGTNRISDRQMLGVTLALSWLALVEARIGSLITAYAKRDVNTPGEQK